MHPFLRTRASVLWAGHSATDAREMLNLANAYGPSLLSELEAVRKSDTSVPDMFALAGTSQDPQKVFESLVGLTAISFKGIKEVTGKEDYKEILQSTFGISDMYANALVSDVFTAEKPTGWWNRVKYGAQWLAKVVLPEELEPTLGNEGPNLDVMYELRLLGRKIIELQERFTSMRETLKALMPASAQAQSTAAVEQMLAPMVGDLELEDAEELGDLDDEDIAYSELGTIYGEMGDLHREIGGPFSDIAGMAGKALKGIGKRIRARLAAKHAGRRRKKGRRKVAIAKRKAVHRKRRDDRVMAKADRNDSVNLPVTVKLNPKVES